MGAGHGIQHVMRLTLDPFDSWRSCHDQTDVKSLTPLPRNQESAAAGSHFAGKERHAHLYQLRSKSFSFSSGFIQDTHTNTTAQPFVMQETMFRFTGIPVWMLRHVLLAWKSRFLGHIVNSSEFWMYSRCVYHGKKEFISHTRGGWNFEGFYDTTFGFAYQKSM